MTTCQKDLMAAGKPYSRTCEVCGLGPCTKHPSETGGAMSIKEKYYCSFCGKHNNDVDKMITKNKNSEHPCICNECVAKCVTILLDPEARREETK